MAAALMPDRLVDFTVPRSRSEAQVWLNASGHGGTDGVVAKRLDDAYHPGKRTMVKVKRMRTADCVVGGFRYQSGSQEVGSLLLGLYDAAGKLNHVGFTSTISNAERPMLTRRLEQLQASPGFTGKAPGGPSRWSTERSTQWQPLRPELVVEVRFDQIHWRSLSAWRPTPPLAAATRPAPVHNGADCANRLEEGAVKIATFNVNGINGRLPVLLRWLAEAQPDIVCLQELKSPDEKFPIGAIRGAGYGAIWHGQKSWNGVAILMRGSEPIETRRGLPGDREDLHSRYIEAAVDGLLIGCLYLPNGNPAPGPKFDYKLRWFERLTSYAAELMALEVPVIMAGTTTSCPRNSMSTNRSVGSMTLSSARKCGRLSIL